MTGISGASPNQPKKQMKNANHDMWNARMGALEKSASRMLVALLLKVISMLYMLLQLWGGQSCPGSPLGTAFSRLWPPYILCRVRVHRPLAAGQIHQHHAVFHAGRKHRQTGGLRRAHRHAGLEIEASPVQRANYRRSRYDSIAQRPALVGTSVLNGDEPAVQIEDRNLQIADPDRPPLARRNILDARNSHPLARIRHTSCAVASQKCLGIPQRRKRQGQVFQASIAFAKIAPCDPVGHEIWNGFCDLDGLPQSGDCLVEAAYSILTHTKKHQPPASYLTVARILTKPNELFGPYRGFRKITQKEMSRTYESR